MVTKINEPKTITKHRKYDCEVCNSNQKWSKGKCWCECKSPKEREKDSTWNPSTYSCENGKYLESNIDNSVGTRDEIIEKTKTSPTKTTSSKTIATILIKRFENVEYFTCLFINYSSISDSC